MAVQVLNKLIFLHTMLCLLSAIFVAAEINIQNLTIWIVLLWYIMLFMMMA